MEREARRSGSSGDDIERSKSEWKLATHFYRSSRTPDGPLPSRAGRCSGRWAPPGNRRIPRSSGKVTGMGYRHSCGAFLFPPRTWPRRSNGFGGAGSDVGCRRGMDSAEVRRVTGRGFRRSRSGSTGSTRGRGRRRSVALQEDEDSGDGRYVRCARHDASRKTVQGVHKPAGS